MSNAAAGWQDTIFALSSGNPPAAIAIVRISGPAAGGALEALAGTRPEPRRATLSAIKDPADGGLLDHALALWFPGPATATGENLAELHLHGGRSVVNAVLGVLGAMPELRQALPGEFTRRAFLNGRIDLAEAEGLADLLAAETEAQRRNALALATGALSRAVEIWREEVLSISARIEASLDFADEDDVPDVDPALLTAACGIAEDMNVWLARPHGERLRDGIRVVLAGPPNAGKSTLLNALVGREAAITASTAGTTRDLIEAPVVIGGIPYLFIDSAGLRDGDDEVERIGVDRARLAIDAADVVLWLGDSSDASVERERAIIVHARCDLPGRNIAPPTADVGVSARTGEGIDALVAMLAENARTLLPGEGEVALNQRQRVVIAEAIALLKDAGGHRDLLLAAEALRLARAALDRLTGRSGVEEMLDALFGRFCIGK